MIWVDSIGFLRFIPFFMLHAWLNYAQHRKTIDINKMYDLETCEDGWVSNHKQKRRTKKKIFSFPRFVYSFTC